MNLPSKLGEELGDVGVEAVKYLLNSTFAITGGVLEGIVPLVDLTPPEYRVYPSLPYSALQK